MDLTPVASARMRYRSGERSESLKPLVLEKMIDRPSGDHAGKRWFIEPCVSSVSPPPSGRIVNRCAPVFGVSAGQPSLLPNQQNSLNRIREPPGDHRGLAPPNGHRLGARKMSRSPWPSAPIV